MNYTPCEQVEIFFQFEQSTSDTFSMQKINVIATMRSFERMFATVFEQPSFTFVLADLLVNLFVRKTISP